MKHIMKLQPKYYDYIKISTTCPINYSDEFLVLYAKIENDGILISDLNSIFEDAVLNGISVEVLKQTAENEKLNFDGIAVFVKTSVNNVGSAINSFFNVVGAFFNGVFVVITLFAVWLIVSFISNAMFCFMSLLWYFVVSEWIV